MPRKKQNEKRRKSSIKNNDRPPAFQPAAEVACFYHAPGPKYILKPVVGYEDHCPSKHRNPAYSIAGKRRRELEILHPSPGPIYSPTFPKAAGISMGLPIKYTKVQDLTPGPYGLPEAPHGPSFSMSWRIPEKTMGSDTPGPYNLPRDLNGPAFTIGTRIQKLEELNLTPPPYLTNVDLIFRRPPAYSLQFKRPDPGLLAATPKFYDPVEPDKGPAFSFGAKHHPCIFPYITPCDKLF